jgi:hypothetical protein
MPDSAENDAKSSTATGARLTATPPDRPKITGASLRSAALALTGAFLGSMALLGYALKPWPPPKVLGSRQLTYDSQQKTASYLGELTSPLVSDGTRLFFTECAGRPRLTEVSTGGGETTSFPADLHIRRVLDISAERHELLALVYDGVQMDTAAIVVPLPAGTPHRLGDVLAHDGSWSPDGTRLVYAFANSLYMSARDGSEPRKLTEISGGSAAFAKQGDE